ncbi:hypothetical protein GCM10010106_20840 [Thermopolyspora flexuosa]|uniref:Putative oligomerization/nucleic acid binding protein n=1 Tax=Thermopolyspora flexuosa TaxID=103836 RepID=A0A543J3C0_9ACTN|nr:DUF4429 domain-containing protein [Thermopolyspora flexuosa]TQM77335.1 putative oligomerization/nucleic acid binding protein [Thermopolyspora flexuosa]GGM74129.1 hypothetical protein GCM10010106_20840 [Thermopolyspora flexuosa]
MRDVLKGIGCVWEFDADGLRIKPDGLRAPRLVRALGERFVPYAAIADVTVSPIRLGKVVLRVRPRPGADPVITAAAGQLRESQDPYRLPLPAKMATLAEYYADETRAAVVDRGPADRFLVAAPEPPLRFKAWDGAASFDGETVVFTWFWSGVTRAKYRAGDQRFRVADLEDVEWHAPGVASGSLRLKVRGRPMPPSAEDDVASVVFGVGYGLVHESLPFAAAVLAAIRAAAPAAATPRPLEAGERPRPASATELAELVRKLGELRDAGLLTEEEFQAKKAELLSRM